MKIAIDSMGGNNVSKAVIEGAIQALKEYEGIECYITGPKEQIEEELKKYQYDEKLINIVSTREVISTNEYSVMALERKKDSSIYKVLRLVKEKECNAIISAGSTGAFLAGRALIAGRIKGIGRPVLTPIMPGKNGSFMIVDAGANVDCKPNYLVQFTKMGRVYYQGVLGSNNPSIGLVNIGAEEEKGNELTKIAHKLLKEENSLNFIGSVEPRDTSKGDVNVLVCDGFVGNTLSRMYEGVASTLLKMIKEEVLSGSIISKIGAGLLSPVFKTLKVKFDYKEYGGVLFLGMEGIRIKAHGSSDGKAFKNAIRQTKTFYDNGVLEKVKEELQNNI